MKKIILFVALAAVAGAIIGCGAKEEGDTAAKTPPATTPADKPTDDKAAATGTTGAPAPTPDGGETRSGEAKPGESEAGEKPAEEKPTDDKAAAGK